MKKKKIIPAILAGVALLSINSSVKATDYYEPYIRGTSRLDLISYDYYGSPDYDWLILMANPSAGNLEFEIPDGTILRIPYPLSVTLELYDREIERHNALYGINS